MKNVKRKEMHPDITAIKGYTRKWFLDKKKKNGELGSRN